MPDDRTSMLRQLFLWPITIASYSPEPLNSDRRKAGYKTPGMEVRPQTAKIGLIGIPSCVLI